MTQRRGRGFASMDPEAQRAIASMGGRAAHESGHAHEWNSEEAAKAGHRGGLAAHRRNRGGSHREGAAHSPGAASQRRGAVPADARAQGELPRPRKVRRSKHSGQHAPGLAGGAEENTNHDERESQGGVGHDSVP
jgi:general stress protein YciG